MGIISLAAILGYVFWYFFYASTPEYALNKLQQAFKAKDLATIEKYCDMESITGRAYDDLTRDMFAHDSHLTDETKVMFETFYMKIKPQVVSETNALILDFIPSGQWAVPTGNNILKGRQLGIDYEYLVERSQLRNTEFIKIDSVKKTGSHEAIAKIAVRDTYTGTLFTLHVLMVERDGEWKVCEIKNYRDYLDFLSPIQENGLKNYIQATSDIIEKYNDILDSQQTHFKRLDKSSDGVLTASMRSKMVAYIRSDIIPALEKRQQELDNIPVNDGGQYLATQRKESSRLTAEAWRHFIEALETDSPDEYNMSKSFQKDAMDIDYRIDDVVKNTAISSGKTSTIP
ncbi:hypothetical protein D081_2197 [Anaerovibrio sp. JC8]|nr:hypothetical protein D081_2197 [Anaerovibrio sp. JC8]